MVHTVGVASGPSHIEDATDADIDALYDSEVRAALAVLQDGRRAGADRFVFVIPSIVATGAAGFGPTCAAAEAVRVLAIGAARQWEVDGVTVNCVAVPFPYSTSSDADVAALVAFLGTDAAAHISGTTIPIGLPEMGL